VGEERRVADTAEGAAVDGQQGSEIRGVAVRNSNQPQVAEQRTSTMGLGEGDSGLLANLARKSTGSFLNFECGLSGGLSGKLTRSANAPGRVVEQSAMGGGCDGKLGRKYLRAHACTVNGGSRRTSTAGVAHGERGIECERAGQDCAVERALGARPASCFHSDNREQKRGGGRQKRKSVAGGQALTTAGTTTVRCFCESAA